MALRDQPYLPLYIQDYLTDEKLNMCSWQTQGIYIKILCILHKQKKYGSILYKQKYKQTESIIKDFALILVKQMPCQMNDMENALSELIDNEVLMIKNNELYQKRMLKDGETSIARSIAGKKGGGNPNLYKQKYKQKYKQTPKQKCKQIAEDEYEDEYESDNENVNENVNIIKFEKFWEEYDKKVSKLKTEPLWNKLSNKDRELIIDYIPEYKLSQPDKSYRKNPDVFIRNRAWEDEIIIKQQTKGLGSTRNIITDKDQYKDL